MQIPITYTKALSRHPVEVARIIAKARRSKSKYKNSDPANWIWGYSVSVALDVESDFLWGPEKASMELTFQEACDQRLQSTGVRLFGRATKGSFKTSTKVAAREQTEILEWVREFVTSERACAHYYRSLPAKVTALG